MKKFSLIIGIITVIIIAGGVLLLSKPEKTISSPLPTIPEYFWGDGCPHCKIVQDFVDSWEKKDKLQITKYEVWNNIKNAALLKERYTYCKIPSSEMGVPLVFTPEGKCISGDQPIIEYYKSINP